jgi:hypothetical protein
MPIGTTISHTCYNLIVEFSIISCKSCGSCASKIVLSGSLELLVHATSDHCFLTSTDGPCSNQKNHLTFIVVPCEDSPFLFLDTPLMQLHDKYLHFAGL